MLTLCLSNELWKLCSFSGCAKTIKYFNEDSPTEIMITVIDTKGLCFGAYYQGATLPFLFDSGVNSLLVHSRCLLPFIASTGNAPWKLVMELFVLRPLLFAPTIIFLDCLSIEIHLMGVLILPESESCQVRLTQSSNSPFKDLSKRLDIKTGAVHPAPINIQTRIIHRLAAQ